jgi:hypothetical protein
MEGGRVEDIRIVEALKKCVEATKNKIIENSNSMVSKAHDLNMSWKDNQYNDFLSFIETLSENLKKNAEALTEAIDALKRELSD